MTLAGVLPLRAMRNCVTVVPSAPKIAEWVVPVPPTVPSHVVQPPANPVVATTPARIDRHSYFCAGPVKVNTGDSVRANGCSSVVLMTIAFAGRAVHVVLEHPRPPVGPVAPGHALQLPQWRSSLT